MTIADTLARGTGLLAGSSESARSDALFLLESVLARPRTWIVAHGEASSDSADVDKFLGLCRRRASGMPLAYVLCAAGFYGREFFVNDSVLVPRPETEHLVDEAIAFLAGLPADRTPAVLDVGTGSGAIACSIAVQTRACVDATDASPAAIAVATENARRLNVTDRCRVFAGDLTVPVRGRRYDVVIANLPYMPTADIPKAPNPLAFEPRSALDGGPDGLAVYRRLLRAVAQHLKARSLLLLEAAPPTIEALRRLTAAALKDFVIETRFDYAGLARYVTAERNHS